MDGLAKLRQGLRRCAPLRWTDERIAYLKARWSQGVTARRIARELGGGISPSAVLGKIHRLGFAKLSPHAWIHRSHRGSGSERRIPRQILAERPFGGIHPSQQWLVPAWVIEAKPYVDDPGLDADIPCAQRRSLLELTDGACRWPVGDPIHPDFFFCGAEALQGTPYCAAHGVRARRSTGRSNAGRGKRAPAQTMRRYRGLDAFTKPGVKIANGCKQSGKDR